MNDNFYSRYLKSYSYKGYKAIPLNFSDISLKPISRIKKNISTIEKSHTDLSFNFFSFSTQVIDKNHLLPPRNFFKKTNFLSDSLLTLNDQTPLEHKTDHLEYLKNLRLFGTLKQRKDKSVFLDIKNDFFINQFFNSIKDDITKNQNFQIEVISSLEFEKNEVIDILEIGQKFQFKIESLFSTYSFEDDVLKKVYFLEISSKELQEFRYKYHLFPKKNGHNFFITLGHKSQFKLKKSFPKMMINIAIFAA